VLGYGAAYAGALTVVVKGVAVEAGASVGIRVGLTVGSGVGSTVAAGASVVTGTWVGWGASVESCAIGAFAASIVAIEIVEPPVLPIQPWRRKTIISITANASTLAKLFACLPKRELRFFIMDSSYLFLRLYDSTISVQCLVKKLTILA
jgi:hypothetical protein